MARAKTNKITRSLRIEPELYERAQRISVEDPCLADFSDYVTKLIQKDLDRRGKKTRMPK